MLQTEARPTRSHSLRPPRSRARRRAWGGRLRGRPGRLVPRGAAGVVGALVLCLPAGLGAQQPGPRQASAGPASAAASPPAGTAWIHPARFEKRDGTLGEVERGVLFVPVDRTSPEGGTLGLEFWRFRAGPEAPGGAPPIFVLRGGPGWPGLGPDLEREGFFERSVEPLLRISDVIYIGQRGIGSSRPHTICEAPTGTSDDATDEERRAAVRDAAVRCRAWWTERGVDLEGFTVIEAAADVDAVRRALGYDRITISGGSFGSHWGMAVMRFHPEIVERALLTGMEGPDHTYDSPTGILNALSRIAADAEDSPRLRGELPEGGLIEALRAVVERLEREPVVVPVEDPESGEVEEARLDADAVRSLSDGYLGRVDGRRSEASWPSGVIALWRGEYEAAARDLAGGSSGGGGFWTTASFFQLDCGSGISASREAALLADTARRMVGEQNGFYRAACPAWSADLGEAFRENFDTPIPTVIVHGDWDLSTPLENALELRPHFTNGTFVRVVRGSHGALGEARRASEAFGEALLRFLETGETAGLPERVELPEPYWVTPEEARAGS